MPRAVANASPAHSVCSLSNIPELPLDQMEFDSEMSELRPSLPNIIFETNPFIFPQTFVALGVLHTIQALNGRIRDRNQQLKIALLMWKVHYNKI